MLDIIGCVDIFVGLYVVMSILFLLVFFGGVIVDCFNCCNVMVIFDFINVVIVLSFIVLLLIELVFILLIGIIMFLLVVISVMYVLVVMVSIL